MGLAAFQNLGLFFRQGDRMPRLLPCVQVATPGNQAVEAPVTAPNSEDFRQPLLLFSLFWYAFIQSRSKLGVVPDASSF
jgi:hypothetical protein